MTRTSRDRQFSFLTSDRFHIDGEAYVFAGETDSGYLFFQPEGGESIVEIASAELAGVMLDPGRFLLEPEFFKNGRRK